MVDATQLVFIYRKHESHLARPYRIAVRKKPVSRVESDKGASASAPLRTLDRRFVIKQEFERECQIDLVV